MKVRYARCGREPQLPLDLTNAVESCREEQTGMGGKSMGDDRDDEPIELSVSSEMEQQLGTMTPDREEPGPVETLSVRSFPGRLSEAAPTRPVAWEKSTCC